MPNTNPQRPTKRHFRFLLNRKYGSRHVEAWCSVCPDRRWNADGAWPLAAASKHTRSTGHRTVATSSVDIIYTGTPNV